MLVNSVCRDIMEEQQQPATTQEAIVDVEMEDPPAEEMLDWPQPDHSTITREDTQRGASRSTSGWNAGGLYPVYGSNDW